MSQSDEEIDFDQWDDDEYDVDGMKFDHAHGNFRPEDADRYLFTNQIAASFANGQFTQAKQMCAARGLNYELERYKFDGFEG